MKLTNFFLMVLLCTFFSTTTAFGYDALPAVVNGVMTFTKTTTIKPRSVIPDACNKIIINAGVTVYGNFYFKGANRTIVVEGKDRATSIISGSKSTFVKGDRTLSAVRVDSRGFTTIRNLTSTDCANFHFTGFGSASIENCNVTQPNGQESVDGVHFGEGAKISSCYFNIHDDCLYIGEVPEISNTTIMHNKNGACGMVAWGKPPYLTGKTKFTSVTFKDNSTGSTAYNQGVIGWAKKDTSILETATVEFVSCTWSVNTGKTKCAYFYSFGIWDGSKVAKNCRIQQYGGDCSWPDTRLNRPGSNGSVLKPSSCPKSAILSEEAISNVTPKTITVIPNIASANQTLEFHLPFGIETEPANLKIYNTSGQCVQSMRFCSDFGQTITLKNLKSGMHLLTAEVGGEVYKTKLIVK